MTEHRQNLKDAVALTTSLLHAQDAGESNDWTEPYQLAQELNETNGHEVMMGLAHVTTVVLRYASDLAAAAQAEGVSVEGIPGGVTPVNLLQELGRQVIEDEAEG